MTDQVKALTAKELALLKKWVDENEFKKITPPAWEKWRHDVCRFLATIESMQRELERKDEALKQAKSLTINAAPWVSHEARVAFIAAWELLHKALAPQGKEER